MHKRIVALILCFVMGFSIIVLPVSAKSRSVDDALDYIFGNLFDVLLGKGGDETAFTGIPNLIQAFLGDGKTPETATQDDWKNAYISYTTNIQNNYGTTSLTSDGGLLITVPGVLEKPVPNPKGYTISGTLSSGGISHVSGGYSLAVYPMYKFNAPIDGTYTIHQIPNLSTSYIRVFTLSGAVYQDLPYGVLHSQDLGFKSKGAAAYVMTTCSVDGAASVMAFMFNASYPSCVFSFPANVIIKVVPLTAPPYTSDSRTGSLSGNFGYYGDNGKLIAAENIKIVDETNNTIYNPATGTTSTVTNWSYDYSDRSYNATTTTGDTVTITYGDENVTIKEGDTIYNIYYMLPPGSGTVDPTPTPTVSPSVPPTEFPVVPSPTVSPSAPPTDGEGEEGFLSWLQATLDKLLDGIISIVNMLTEKLQTVLDSLFKIFDEVPGMFTGFTDFLGNVFSFVPPEIITILTFGILAVVLVAIIRMILGK